MKLWFMSALERAVGLVMAGVIIGALACWVTAWWVLGPRRK